MSKHYYLYIEAGAAIDDGTRFFAVGIGTGKQATRDYLFLLGHAVSNGFFFERYSIETANFMVNVSRSLGLQSVWDLNVTQIDARELVRSIKTKSAAHGNPCAAENAEAQRLMLNADYRFMSKLRGQNHLPSGNHV